jgi:hypothetical protein
LLANKLAHKGICKVLVRFVKNLVYKFQHKFLGNKLHKMYSYSKEKKTGKFFDNRFTNYYFTPRKNLFSELCDMYGSDKGSLKMASIYYPWQSHTYSDYYTRLFLHCRERILNVFECGIGTNNPILKGNMTINGMPGASLRVWRDYFPNAKIIGADIDRDILFKEDRIETFFIDQTSSKSIQDFWKEVKTANFDLMVDDGLHKFEAGLNLFENSVHKLAPNGIYIIEDVSFKYLQRYVRWFKSREEFSADFVLMSKSDLSADGNSLISIRRSHC